MHREPLQFVASVKQQAPEFFTGKKVLEVGSLDINGSVRQFFTDCDYTGIDLGAGAGVDEVCHVAEMGMSFDGAFDVVISSESLEHDERWNHSLLRMGSLLKPSGILIVTCAAPNRPEHGTTRTGSADASPFTLDYYRNISVENFASVLPAGLFERSYLGYRGNMDDLYFVGIKLAVSWEDAKRAFREMDVRTQPILETVLRQSETLPDVRWHSGERQPVVSNKEYSDMALQGIKRLLEKEDALLVDPLAALINMPESERVFQPRKSPLTVTAEISTKDRLTTTLPMCISAILMQTRKPEKLVIYDDGEQKDLSQLPPFDGLLQLALNHLGIQWVFYSTERKGQVTNHQHALDNATTDLIWRVDDDEIPEPNCLENLLAEMKDGVGAVAGLVHHPNNVAPLPDHVTGTVEDIDIGTNVQWFSWNGGPREVEHLYSTFLYSAEAARKAGGYPRELSAVGHREESWFTIRLRQAGYKLIVTPCAKTWHLRQDTGGIRSFSDSSLWQHDENLFQEYLKAIGHVALGSKLAILDSGIGDHFLFRGLLVDEFKRKYPERKWTLAVCHPEVFEDIDGVTVISIAEAKLIVGDRYQSEYSLFDYGWRCGNGRHILDVMREFYA